MRKEEEEKEKEEEEEEAKEEEVGLATLQELFLDNYPKWSQEVKPRGVELPQERRSREGEGEGRREVRKEEGKENQTGRRRKGRNIKEAEEKRNYRYKKKPHDNKSEIAFDDEKKKNVWFEITIKGWIIENIHNNDKTRWNKIQEKEL